MKFNLTKEQKLKAYNEALVNLENGLVLRLSVLGIDIDSFDEDSFSPRENSTADQDIVDLIFKIKNLRLKIENIE